MLQIAGKRTEQQIIADQKQTEPENKYNSKP